MGTCGKVGESGTGLCKALCFLSWSFGWYDFTGVTLLAFYGGGRIGEVLKCRRHDLVLPSDTFDPDQRGAFLQLRSFKSLHRQPAKIQHMKIVHLGAVYLLRAFFDNKANKSLLFEGSPHQYRKRWDFLINLLGIDKSLRLTPGGLRGGAAVAMYRQERPISDIAWALRLRHQSTLESYLQECSALTVFSSFDPKTRSLIKTGAFLFSLLADGAVKLGSWNSSTTDKRAWLLRLAPMSFDLVALLFGGRFFSSSFERCYLEAMVIWFLPWWTPLMAFGSLDDFWLVRAMQWKQAVPACSNQHRREQNHMVWCDEMTGCSFEGLTHPPCSYSCWEASFHPASNGAISRLWSSDFCLGGLLWWPLVASTTFDLSGRCSENKPCLLAAISTEGSRITYIYIHVYYVLCLGEVLPARNSYWLGWSSFPTFHCWCCWRCATQVIVLLDMQNLRNNSGL